jgi:hypothetical protein
MAFTYVGDLSTDLDKVRFHIQDSTENSGPLPGDGNFTDAELNGLITEQGAWQRAVAAAFDVLGSAWAIYADKTVGPRSESLSQIAERYEERAEKWREKYGLADTAGTSFLRRIDEYSDDVSHDEISGDDYTDTSATTDNYFEWRGY